MEIEPGIREEIVDAEHLRLLSIGHYITGGLYIGFASIFIFHFVFLFIAAFHPDLFARHGQWPQSGQWPRSGAPDTVFRILAVLLGTFIAAGWAIGGLTIAVGRCIK